MGLISCETFLCKLDRKGVGVGRERNRTQKVEFLGQYTWRLMTEKDCPDPLLASVWLEGPQLPR